MEELWSTDKRHITYNERNKLKKKVSLLFILCLFKPGEPAKVIVSLSYIAKTSLIYKSLSHMHCFPLIPILLCVCLICELPSWCFFHDILRQNSDSVRTRNIYNSPLTQPKCELLQSHQRRDTHSGGESV